MPATKVEVEIYVRLADLDVDSGPRVGRGRRHQSCMTRVRTRPCCSWRMVLLRRMRRGGTRDGMRWVHEDGGDEGDDVWREEDDVQRQNCLLATESKTFNHFISIILAYFYGLIID